MEIDQQKINIIIKALAEISGITILLSRELSDLKYAVIANISEEDRVTLNNRQQEIFEALEAVIKTLGRLTEDSPK
jgi:hypothetical protein